MKKNYSIDVSIVIERDYFPTDHEAAEMVIASLRERMREGVVDGCLTVTEGDDAPEPSGRFTVISPDGLAIAPDPFATREEAYRALNAWVQRFADQGYYAAANGERIELTWLADRCTLELVRPLSTAAEWAEKIITAIEQGKREILEDISTGRVPATVKDFSDLHDYVDANEYGGLCENGWLESDITGDMTDDTHNAASAVQDALHAWLVAGRPTA